MYWEKIIPYFRFENATRLNKESAYAVYPVEINDAELYVCLGTKDNDAKLISNADVHIIDNKFFIIVSKNKIDGELL